MFRLVAYLFLAIIGLTVIRSVIGWVTRLIANFLLDETRPANISPAPDNVSDLKKDPICGTFVPVVSSPSLSVRGRTHYFCSEKCLREFQTGRTG